MNKDFNFEEIGKRTPYRTPEGFFENVQANILKRADEERRRRSRKPVRWSIALPAMMAIAAMVCGFVFLTGNPTETSVQDMSVEWVAQLADDADVMDLYIHDLTDEELEEWIEFSENDIYYELTTQNSNEDED